MNIEKEIKLRFPNIDCENWKQVNVLLFNHRMCKLKSHYRITFVIKGIANYIYIYQFRFGYVVRYTGDTQLFIFLKNSEYYKIFQIIADHERRSNN